MSQAAISTLVHRFGTDINKLLNDQDVVELMLNDDGRIWIDTHSRGSEPTAVTLSSVQASSIISLIAGATGQTVNEQTPILQAELPGWGFRVQALVPPLVKLPIFTIRKHAAVLFTLQDYVRDGIMTERQAAFLQEAVQSKKNILVVGGMGSGKTTLLNALLQVMADCDDRIVLLQDTLGSVDIHLIQSMTQTSVTKAM